MMLNESASGGIVNAYNNEIGDIGALSGWLNWQYPSSEYHQSGMFIAGTTYNLTAYIWNNYIHGDLGQGSPSGMLYCTAWSSSTGGCNGIAWNNVLVGTGSALTNDQLVAANQPGVSGQEANLALYNNTLVNGGYQIEWYTYGNNNPTMAWQSYNNIFSGSGASWFYTTSNGGTYLASFAADGNVYYNGISHPWQYNNDVYSSLAAWQAGCGCDSNAQLINPGLKASNAPSPFSPITTTGTNLTALCSGDLVLLCRDKNGSPRPATGSWSAGAFQPPASPTGVVAVVH
jgi:hypothetical protein